MSLKLAIWDVDGTIIDSRRTISVCMDRAFEKEGFEAPGYALTRTMVGLGLFEGIASIAPDGTSEQKLHQICASYKSEFVAHRSEPGFVEKLYDGAMDAIKNLAEADWLLAISTGKSRRGLEAVFKMHPLKHFFDTIWCADDGPGKPNPFMCLEAMNAVGAEAEQTVMIGDAVHDMRMARAAGITAYGVSWGFGTSDELVAAGANGVFDTFQRLNAALQSF